MLSAAAATPASAQAANSEPAIAPSSIRTPTATASDPNTPGSNRQGDAVEDDPVEAAPVSPPVKPAKPRKQAHRSASATAGTKTPNADAAAKQPAGARHHASLIDKFESLGVSPLCSSEHNAENPSCHTSGFERGGDRRSRDCIAGASAASDL